MLGPSPSMASMSSQSSKWEDHVKATIRRNERIRLQSEATKLRSAFVTHDTRLTGSIPGYMLRSCLKSGGVQLPEGELRAIYKKFQTSDGQFGWLQFCENLERGKDPPSFHPKRALMRPVSALSPAALPRGSVTANFRAHKASRQSLGDGLSASQSQGSLASGYRPASAVDSKAASRMRRMVSEASIASIVAEKERTTKIMGLADWFNKQDAPAPEAPTSRPVSRGATPTALVRAATPPALAPNAAPAAPVPKIDTAAELARKKQVKDLMSMAESGLNSRFTDMFKAFQYVDLDRSGRLDKNEIKRALDLWNVPIDDAKLDLIMSECDADGDGGVSYEEFVDKLARETVAPAAMGKRGMQSKEAMGVDSQEMLAQQLGHKNFKEKFNPTING
jgi:Ca2+-binding EF-hand superfamily protein